MINHTQTDAAKTVAYSRLGSPCRRDAGRRSFGPTRQNVLLFFPSRATCSHCWQIAFILSSLQKRLLQHDTKVVVVVEEQYLLPARRLAQELGLQLRFTSRSSQLARCLRPGGSGEGGEWGLVLMDRRGLVCFQQDNRLVAKLKVSELLQVVERVNRPRVSLAFADCLAC